MSPTVSARDVSSRRALCHQEPGCPCAPFRSEARELLEPFARPDDEPLSLGLSVLGVGLELYGAVPSDLMGSRISIEVQTLIGGAVSIQLADEVRNTAPGPRGGVRVGMEFVGLSDTERSILDTLELMQMAW